MHIKRAKQEIKDSIEAYLKKDAAGNYVMPHVRQRPTPADGPPGSGKHRSWSRRPESAESVWSLIQSPITPDRVRRAAVYPGERVRGQEGFGNRVYHERDHCFGVR